MIRRLRDILYILMADHYAVFAIREKGRRAYRYGSASKHLPLLYHARNKLARYISVTENEEED